MKNKRIFLLAASLFAIVLSSMAQDVTVFHMKDGTQRRFQNGQKTATYFSFYQLDPSANQFPAGFTTTHDNGQTVSWNVNQVWKVDGQYVVAVAWTDDVPVNFGPRPGVCFGSAAGITVDNCDQMVYATDAMVSPDGMSKLPFSVLFPNGHYMLIGPVADIGMTMTLKGRDVSIQDTEANRIVTRLEPGRTYYYRTFAEGKVLEQGEEKTIVFYGEEQSFQVPPIMDDLGY